MTRPIKSSKLFPNHRISRGKAGFSASLASILLCMAPAQAQQRVLYSAAPPSMAERQRASQIIVQYLAMWNERDPERRRVMISQVFAEDGVYMDPNRHGVGHQDMETLISSGQKAYPGYSLRLVSTIDTHHGEYIRFSWAGGGTPDAPLYLAGTNFARLAADGRIQSMIGFGDAAAISLPVR